MGKADFHRRWARRLLRFAIGAKDEATRDQLRLMAADSLEKAARSEREGEEMPASAGVVEGPSEKPVAEDIPIDEPPAGSQSGS